MFIRLVAERETQRTEQAAVALVGDVGVSPDLRFAYERRGITSVRFGRLFLFSERRCLFENGEIQRYKRHASKDVA